ncbi:hypothetical protein QQF64_014927 [Cirrhinus molitorella]|uniref:Secreted protein n=1 Tax=Cirrhinus molitorella TaxID=172907 RepID=A0ABR3NTZ4_9TELE
MTLLCSTVGFSCLLSHCEATLHLPSIYASAQSLERHKPTKGCEIISDKCTRLPYSQHKARTPKEGAFASLRSYIVYCLITIYFFFFLSPHRKAVQESSP